MRHYILFICLFIILLLSEPHSACDGKCVKKCCGTNQHVHYSTTSNVKSCETNTVSFDISALKVYDDELREIGHAGDFAIEYGAFDDDMFRDSTMLAEIFYKSSYLLQNGSILMEERSDNVASIYDNNNYCIDYRMDKNRTIRNDIIVWFIPPVEENNFPILYNYTMMISCVFLILVLVVYGLLPELRNLSGLTLMAYVTCLLFEFIFIICLQVWASEFEPPVCFAFTLLIYFFIISSFGWINVMSYDIWWTFRGYAKARPINRRGDIFKFKVYCMYSFGIAVVLTIILGLLNNWTDEEPAFIRMQIPSEGCFIEGKAKWVYLYLPMLIMILANWLFYALTAFNIWRLYRGTNLLNSTDSAVTGTASARHRQKERLKVYLKLTVLMGLNWIHEVVSALQPDLPIWYLFDIYNLLGGLVIFIIFVCKKNVYVLLKKRFNQNTSPHVNNNLSNTKTTSSADLALLNVQTHLPDQKM